jgi:hypothetical protein
MHAPSKALLVSLLAGAAAVAVAVGACTSADGQTPSCTPNVDQNGIHPDPNGCDQFPVCTQPKISDCCTDADGGALTGNDLAACRHGFGDPACAFLSATYDMMNNVTYTCEMTPPGGNPDGG